MNAFEVIKTVRLTEKGTRQGEKYNQYTVVADRLATKPQIRQAVQELFKVKVVRVNTLNVRGKARRQRTPQAGQCVELEKGHRHPQGRRQDCFDVEFLNFGTPTRRPSRREVNFTSRFFCFKPGGLPAARLCRLDRRLRLPTINCKWSRHGERRR